MLILAPAATNSATTAVTPIVAPTVIVAATTTVAAGVTNAAAAATTAAAVVVVVVAATRNVDVVVATLAAAQFRLKFPSNFFEENSHPGIFFSIFWEAASKTDPAENFISVVTIKMSKMFRLYAAFPRNATGAMAYYLGLPVPDYGARIINRRIRPFMGKDVKTQRLCSLRPWFDSDI